MTIADLTKATYRQLADLIYQSWPTMPPRLRFYVSVIGKIPQQAGRLTIDESLTIHFFLLYSKEWATEDACAIKAELKARQKNRK